RGERPAEKRLCHAVLPAPAARSTFRSASARRPKTPPTLAFAEPTSIAAPKSRADSIAPSISSSRAWHVSSLSSRSRFRSFSLMVSPRLLERCPERRLGRPVRLDGRPPRLHVLDPPLPLRLLAPVVDAPLGFILQRFRY